jgi:hypothetical protein
MVQTPPELAIKLDAGPDSDPEQLDELTRALRHELLELDVEAVEFVSAGEAPEQAKGFGLASVGALIVRIVSGSALNGVAEVIKAWTSRDANRSVKLVMADESIELSGVSSGQAQQMLDAWVQKVMNQRDG